MPLTWSFVLEWPRQDTGRGYAGRRLSDIICRVRGKAVTCGNVIRPGCQDLGRAEHVGKLSSRYLLVVGFMAVDLRVWMGEGYVMATE